MIKLAIKSIVVFFILTNSSFLFNLEAFSQRQISNVNFIPDSVAKLIPPLVLVVCETGSVRNIPPDCSINQKYIDDYFSDKIVERITELGFRSEKSTIEKAFDTQTNADLLFLFEYEIYLHQRRQFVRPELTWSAKIRLKEDSLLLVTQSLEGLYSQSDDLCNEALLRNVIEIVMKNDRYYENTLNKKTIAHLLRNESVKNWTELLQKYEVYNLERFFRLKKTPPDVLQEISIHLDKLDENVVMILDRIDSLRKDIVKVIKSRDRHTIIQYVPQSEIVLLSIGCRTNNPNLLNQNARNNGIIFEKNGYPLGPKIINNNSNWESKTFTKTISVTGAEIKGGEGTSSVVRVEISKVKDLSKIEEIIASKTKTAVIRFEGDSK